MPRRREEILRRKETSDATYSFLFFLLGHCVLKILPSFSFFKDFGDVDVLVAV